MNIKQAVNELRIAETLNPGPWIQHSFNVASGAKLITEAIGKYNPENAYIYGLLHDIGRRTGFSYLRHVFDGYRFLKDIDKKASFICLSHSFPNKDINEYQGEIDISKEEIEEIANVLEENEYDYYDRLIQLMDSYADHKGYCHMQIRWVDVSIRNGVNEFTRMKWKKLLEINNEMNDTYGIKIDEILNI